MKKMTLQDVLAARQAISQEAVMNLHHDSGPIRAFSSLVSKASKLVQDKINGVRVFLSPKGVKNVGTSYEYFVKFTEATKYGDVKKMTLQVPEGFKGNYLAYAQALRQAAELCYMDFIDRMVVPFDIHVSRLINEPVLLNSVSYRHNVQIKDIEVHKKALANFFTGRKHTTLTLGEVFDRNADIKALSEELVLLTRLIENQDIKETLSKIDLLNKRVLKLVDIITSKTNNISVAPNVLDELSHLVFELAKQTEFYAVIDSMINSLLYASQVNNNAFQSWLESRSALEALKDSPVLSVEGLLPYLTNTLKQ